MIEKTIETWHRILRGELPDGLDDLLADDCVFYSPIVFTPQKGKAISKLYLQAAGATFAGDADPGKALEQGVPDTKFRYVKQVLSGNQAVLEFEARVDGKVVNGVDIISCDDTGRIVEFKVMVRPLQAVNLLHQKMAAMLETMKPVA